VLQHEAGRRPDPSIDTMARLRLFCCAVLALASSAALPAQADAAKARTVPRELDRLLAAGAIDQLTHDADLALQKAVKRRVRELTGTPQRELNGALKVVDGIARRGQLRASRLAPVFLELQRNLEWWGGGGPALANGQRITFPDSELVWQEVPGQGLHLHPLANFGKLNAFAKGSRRTNARAGQLLDELMAIAVPRGGGLAWEYYFTFDGGKGPWVSGLAQGTGLQAIARTAQKLGRLEELRPAIEQGLTLFEQAPPTGVRIATPDGAHYAQYSFWPSLRILNGFVQSLVGLFDVAQITGSPRAQALFAAGEAQAKVEAPTYDTGAWSFYSRGAIKRESDLAYHELLRDFLVNLCDRTAATQFCTTATHFTTYLSVPPEIELRTDELRGGKDGTLAFSLSKISTATVTVTAPDGRQILRSGLGRVGRGTHALQWAVPRKAGTYALRVDATDLAGNPADIEGDLEVLKPKRKRRG
jgi:D-glucuronyl C5-epimerase C-terminus